MVDGVLHVRGTLERIDPDCDTLLMNMQFIILFRTIYITSLFNGISWSDSEPDE